MDGRYELDEENDAPDGDANGSPAVERDRGLVDSRDGYGEAPVPPPYRGASRPEELLSWGTSLSRIASEADLSRGERLYASELDRSDLVIVARTSASASSGLAV